jgi:hypothetical protein
MRDAQLHSMHHAIARRTALLLAQLEFLETRQEAMDRLLKVSKFIDRLGWIWSPLKFLQVLDATQLILMQQRRDQRAKIAAKPKIYVPTHNA